MRTLPPLPACVGPAEFGELGRLVAVRAPRELDDIFRQAGGMFGAGITALAYRAPPHRAGDPRAASNKPGAGYCASSRPAHAPPRLLQLVHHLKI
jgi:hypothetical protein